MTKIKKIAIVGGGTAGWIAASVLAKECSQQNVDLVLVESEEIGTIGVGESTIPPLLDLLQNLNIDEKDFIQKNHASFKLGIEFVDWYKKGHRYFHPFGSISAGMNEDFFYHAWLNSQEENVSEEGGLCLQDYSSSFTMAKHKKFFLPQSAQGTPIEEARYALHLDAQLVAQYLRAYAEERGVKRIQGKLTHASLMNSGGIHAITLEDGSEVQADFFIDCTGFHAVLIEKYLNVEFIDWSNYLACDRAVVVQTELTEDIPPYTKATALDHGWCWRIPLQTRTGNGYVYASQYCDDELAQQTLINQLDAKPVTDPRVIRYKTGVRKDIWKDNCLAIGLAAGFVEPLESTAIHLVIRGMLHFIQHFPDKDMSPPFIAEYNKRMTQDYEEIRDFIVLHYCLTQRDDTPFWRWCKTMELPDTLRYTLDYFKVHGGLPAVLDPLFHAVNWRCVCEGMGISPKKNYPLIDNYPLNEAFTQMQKFKSILNEQVNQLPSHAEFIRSNCPAEQS